MQVKFGWLFWIIFFIMFMEVLSTRSKLNSFEKKTLNHFMFIEKELKLIK